MKPITKNAGKFLFGAGWALLLFGTVAKIFDYGQSVSGFALGVGCGFIAVGTALMYRRFRNPKQAREEEIVQKDERFIKIREKSAYAMYFVTLFALAIVVFVFLCLDYTIPGYIAIGLIAVHSIGYFIFLHLNNKKL
jgi:uncharacterized membrane protein